MHVVPAPYVVEVESLAALDRALVANPCTDLVLLGLYMVDTQGFSTLAHLCVRYPSIAIAIISATDSATIVCRSLDLGTLGLIPESAVFEQIGKVLRALLEGSSTDRCGLESDPARNVSSLTVRQMRVLRSLSNGLSNKIIAQDLGVTEATIKAHMTVILRKLGLERRTQAALLAQRILHSGSPTRDHRATNADTFESNRHALDSSECESVQGARKPAT
jgi:DNA-binding NarL/FixJ family response regulator